MALSVAGYLLSCSFCRQPPACRFPAVRLPSPPLCRLRWPLRPSPLDLGAISVSYRRRLSRLHSHPPLLLGSGDGFSSLSVFSDSLKLLEWDKVCDAVAAFAGTSLGRKAVKSQLSSVDVSFEESRRLLEETTAAVRLIDYGGGGIEFAGVDTVLVKSAITRVSRGSSLDGLEAIAIAALIQFADALQITVETAVKEDTENYNHFMPLSELIINLVISHSFAKSVQQVIDEDGSVKDSASSEVRRSRDQVRIIERKLYQLMDKLIRQDKNDTASLEMCIVNGRCCLKVMSDQRTLDGLLLSSGSGLGSIIEPISAVPLNDELQQARVLVTKAEEYVLSKLTDKMVAELENIQKLLEVIIRLDVVFARAKYGIMYGGTFPELYLASHQESDPTENLSTDETFSRDFLSSNRKWKLYMPKAYHPLLLQRHREHLHKAKKDLANATSDIRRRSLQGKSVEVEGGFDSHLQSLKRRISELEKSPPVPVDFVVSQSTNVLVITGPNTGGKTISLKTAGLASLMAKTGLYVLAGEPVKIPWFDAIFADIGDEQSLTQSLSTFSGHLKQIGAIRSQSTNKSLVLLDEVGAGTNPLEGAALGMSILESFAEAKSFLTMATTHHGELKTLKYSNDAFENACVEFDETSLKPTYKILWGVPGRSNAINIAERLGLSSTVIEGARKLHGAASAEINEVIVDMEKFKQNFQLYLQQAEHHLLSSKELHEKLVVAKEKVAKNVALQKKRKAQAISDCGTLARSILRNRLQQFRESIEMKSQIESLETDRDVAEDVNQPKVPEMSSGKINLSESNKTRPDETKIPSVGDTVLVPSLGKQAMVLKVEASKGEVLVQASNMKLRLKFKDVQISE